MSENLWGMEPIEPLSEESPRKIVADQAALLQKITGGAVFGTVENADKKELPFPFNQKDFLLALTVFSPKLDGYSKRFFCFGYGIDMYSVDFTNIIGCNPTFIKSCANEQELKTFLKQIFSSDAVRKLISAMITQVRELEDFKAAG
ncbi:MAG: hypothetical protein WCF85_07610 [Rhodospirillaceae bacterium]